MSEKKIENLKLRGFLEGSLSSSIFEQIVESFPDIIHSVDHEGRIISTNRAAEELLGYSKSEMLGMSVFDIYPKHIAPKVKAGFQQLKVEGFKSRIESQLLSKSGEIIDVEIRSLSLYDDNGEFARTFSIIRDIRQLNDLKHQLVQSSKLAAIGELAAGIMHDIRNPLTVISNYNNQFLKEAIQKHDEPMMIKCQASIEKASARIQRLSDHLRTYSRNEVEVAVNMDLAALIEDSLMMVEAKIKGSGITLENQIKGTKINIFLAPNRMEQVIVNLISNACDAMESRPLRVLTLAAEQKDNQTIISISDTGKGISKANLERIFESFYTTKEKGKGTGLGLSIAQSVIYEQGGAITVTSEEEKGTTFFVTLPIHQKK
jgi:two-component system NtrC family sensor kinase